MTNWIDELKERGLLTPQGGRGDVDLRNPKEWQDGDEVQGSVDGSFPPRVAQPPGDGRGIPVPGGNPANGDHRRQLAPSRPEGQQMPSLPSPSPLSIFDDLCQRIKAAAGVEDIEQARKRAQSEFERGKISQEEMDWLMEVANQEELCSPLEGGGHLWGDEGVVEEEIGKAWWGACSCCGRSAWWVDKYGNRKCGVCHPNPLMGKRSDTPN